MPSLGKIIVCAEGSNEEGEGGKRELDRLFDEMQRQNTKSGLLDSVRQTVDRLPLPDLKDKPIIDTSKPFRFPAYGFLLLSVLLGISFTGSLTELATGSPLVSKHISCTTLTSIITPQWWRLATPITPC